MYRRIFIVFGLLIITLLLFLLNVNYSKQKVEVKTKKIEVGINYFNKNILANTDKFSNYFNDRYVIINNDDISIGKNKNELDNGYYDVNLKVEKKHLDIYINKLFKEFDKNSICDENYIKEIVEYIIELFNLEIDKIQFSKLIIDNYEKIRDVDRTNVINIDKVMKISDIYITITEFENMLVLKLGDE